MGRGFEVEREIVIEGEGDRRPSPRRTRKTVSGLSGSFGPSLGLIMCALLIPLICILIFMTAH